MRNDSNARTKIEKVETKDGRVTIRTQDGGVFTLSALDAFQLGHTLINEATPFIECRPFPARSEHAIGKE